MNFKIRLLVFTAVFSLVAIIACNSKRADIAKEERVLPTREDTIERGRYLVTTMLCHDCHSPKVFGPHGPELDSTRLLSGYPSDRPVTAVDKKAIAGILFDPDLTSAVGPWGRSFSANITSDETGIGNWTEEHFFNALRHGKYKGMMNGRKLLPPMPWDMLQHASDEDLRAIFTYLKSTKPVSNIVPAPIPFEEL